MNSLVQYTNGNATISLYADGTRIIESADDKLNLEYPLNIDIRISNRCVFGLNSKTNSAICSFCHESATTDGQTLNRQRLNNLIGVLKELPRGVEIALGINGLDEFDLIEEFLTFCQTHGLIVNITVNQGIVRKIESVIAEWINSSKICGLGISYRSGMRSLEGLQLLVYKNTVIHCIAGIDTIDEVIELSHIGVKKILVLGEKNFGFNFGKVKLTTQKHRDWYAKLPHIFNHFDIVSFDNLALEQLKVKRCVKDWNTFYQHEYSFYINAVDGYFAPSSRSDDKIQFANTNIKEYFQSIT